MPTRMRPEAYHTPGGQSPALAPEAKHQSRGSCRSNVLRPSLKDASWGYVLIFRADSPEEQMGVTAHRAHATVPLGRAFFFRRTLVRQTKTRAEGTNLQRLSEALGAASSTGHCKYSIRAFASSLLHMVKRAEKAWQIACRSADMRVGFCSCHSFFCFLFCHGGCEPLCQTHSIFSSMTGKLRYCTRA